MACVKSPASSLPSDITLFFITEVFFFWLLHLLIQLLNHEFVIGELLTVQDLILCKSHSVACVLSHNERAEKVPLAQRTLSYENLHKRVSLMNI